MPYQSQLLLVSTNLKILEFEEKLKEKEGLLNLKLEQKLQEKVSFYGTNYAQAQI